jgi:hypothetical protein
MVYQKGARDDFYRELVSWVVCMSEIGWAGTYTTSLTLSDLFANRLILKKLQDFPAPQTVFYENLHLNS